MKRIDFIKALGLGVAAAVVTPSIVASAIMDEKKDLVEHWIIESLYSYKVHLRTEVGGAIWKDVYQYQRAIPHKEGIRLAKIRFKDYIESSREMSEGVNWVKMPNTPDGEGYVWYTKAENDQRKKFEAHQEKQTLKMFGL